MRFTRPIVGLLGAALLGLAPAATAPATAVAEVPTFVQGDISSTLMVWQDTFVIQGAIVDGDGTALPDTADGTVVLKRRLAGESTWKTLGEATNEGAWSFPDLVAVQNATYRVAYTGGTADDMTTTYAGTLAQVDVKVARKLNSRGAEPRPGRFFIKGSVKPKWKRKPVVIQRKTCKSCAWKKWDVVKTNRKGKFSARIYAKKKAGKIWYRPMVKPTTQFVRTIGGAVVITTYYYRTAERSSARLG